MWSVLRACSTCKSARRKDSRPMPKGDGFDDTLRVRCDSSLKKRLERIAKRDHRDLSDLIRAVLTRFAEREEQAMDSGKQPGAVLQELAVPYTANNDGSRQ